MLSSNSTSVILLLALITGLLTISYLAGVSEIDDLGDEDDIFRDF